MERLKLI